MIFLSILEISKYLQSGMKSKSFLGESSPSQENPKILLSSSKIHSRWAWTGLIVPSFVQSTSYGSPRTISSPRKGSSSPSTLDTFVDQYVKKWAGLPKGATNVVIHSQQGLDIPTISALYTESHSTSHTRTRLQGDSRINQVLDHTLAREKDLTKSKHITTQCEA